MVISTLKLPGAVAGAGQDEPVPAHYGNPLVEQRALAESSGFVDRSHREMIQVRGQDRLSWLHTLTTQDLESLPPWVSTETLVLSPRGHIEHHITLHDDGEATWLETEPNTGKSLLDHLEKMRFALRVEPTDVSAAWSHITIAGPDSTDVAEELGYPPSPQEGGVASFPHNEWIRKTTWQAVPVYDLFVPIAAREELIGRISSKTTPCGHAAFEALRVAAQHPRLGMEIDHRTLVQEVNMIPRAVHLKKGCYRGQETVAKVQNLGLAPRRMVLLHLDGIDEELPNRGDQLFLDDKPVGFIGTAVVHYEMGPIALGLVKRNVADDASLTVVNEQGRTAAKID